MTLVTGTPAEDPALSVSDDVDVPDGLETVVEAVAAAYVSLYGYRWAQDNFTRADSATTLGTASDGGAWTVDGSALFGITGNKAYLASGSTVPAPMARREVGRNRATFGGDAIANEVSVHLTRTAYTGTSYIWLAYDPTADQGYYVSYDGSDSLSVFKYNAGAPTQIGSDITCTDWASTGTPTVLRVFYDGASDIHVHQDSVELGIVSDGSGLTSGAWAGFGSTELNSVTGETWDNFTATNAQAAEYINVTLTWEGAQAGPFSHRIAPTLASAEPPPESTPTIVPPLGFGDRLSMSNLSVTVTGVDPVLFDTEDYSVGDTFSYDDVTGVFTVNHDAIISIGGKAAFGSGTSDLFTFYIGGVSVPDGGIPPSLADPHFPRNAYGVVEIVVAPTFLYGGTTFGFYLGDDGAAYVGVVLTCLGRLT